ncbi:hypothetical protein ISN45_Aa05g003660 [Arabidopsis thaliana x Arabidopsis arenosa]|uniref:Uncharacterized protein n=1 Tax=Arabidopsis thaliana x Arabidopsis arenosa TaxID=1240361 RepID=A0A8T1ZIZ2_9BRAS|nr:hypothetical protein ISN45_Aa05g003660 [Arabidopsis thaliana x Arabidopsis arenosa]
MMPFVHIPRKRARQKHVWKESDRISLVTNHSPWNTHLSKMLA